MDSTAFSPFAAERPASQLLSTVIDLMNRFIRTGHLKNPYVFVHFCLSLARSIDYATADGLVPFRSRDLPHLIKHVYRWQNDESLQGAFMVLMTSVRSACKMGWFSENNTKDLLMLAEEVGKRFSSSEDINVEESYALSFLSHIISRFYPQMKLDQMLVAIEVKPGYGTFMADFHISRSMVDARHENISLFIAEKGKIDTLPSMVVPPQANFLLNGRAVSGRNISMDNGEQIPMNVTSLVKYGANLLQAIGQFDGHYIILVAVTSTTSSPCSPHSHDDVQPVVTSVDSTKPLEIGKNHPDNEAVGKPLRISLSCPISLRRMKTPVKGHLCKHPECFDHDSFLEINLRQPCWKCPHCNKSVCRMDMRVDQNVSKILREVGDDVVDVIISADGSWKPVIEGQDQFNPLEQQEDCESSDAIIGNKKRKPSLDTQKSPSAVAKSTLIQQETDHNQAKVDAQDAGNFLRVRTQLAAEAPSFTTESVLSVSMVAERLEAILEQRKSTSFKKQKKDDGFVTLAPDESWKSSGRMRGSLRGEAYDAALRQIMAPPPKQPARVPERPPPLSLGPNAPSSMPLSELLANISCRRRVDGAVANSQSNARTDANACWAENEHP